MNRLLLLPLLLLVSCTNVHYVSFVNDTNDTLAVEVYPPLEDWVYALNCMNYSFDCALDTSKGDTTINYSPTGKSMIYLVYPQSNFALEGDIGIPLAEENLKLNKIQVRTLSGKRILKLNNKKKIIDHCVPADQENQVLDGEEELEYEIRLNPKSK